jgi:hypothetical protein
MGWIDVIEIGNSSARAERRQQQLVQQMRADPIAHSKRFVIVKP